MSGSRESNVPAGASQAVMRIKLGLVLVLLVAACATPVPSPSTSATAAPKPSPTGTNSPSPAVATVVIRQEALGGRGFYIEGAYAFVEIKSADGSLAAAAQTDRYHLAQELLRTELRSGDYTLLTYVRPCEAACPLMDPPTDRCEATFTAPPAGLIVMTIRRSIGQACSVDFT